MGKLFTILIAVTVFMLWRRWKKLESEQAKREFFYRGLVFGLIAVIIGLAVYGRIDALGALFASLLLSIKFIIAFGIRHFPIVARVYGVTDGFGLGKTRTLKTPWLEIRVDFSTGKLSGMVLQGEFAERALDELTETELKKLLKDCHQDSRSSYFIHSYINQRFNKSAGNDGNSAAQPPSSSAMSEQEALEVLGLEGVPSADDIKRAHKKLMQKLHPDRGGNDFLASLLNRARDRLTEK